MWNRLFNNCRQVRSMFDNLDPGIILNFNDFFFVFLNAEVPGMSKVKNKSNIRDWLHTQCIVYDIDYFTDNIINHNCSCHVPKDICKIIASYMKHSVSCDEVCRYL